MKIVLVSPYYLPSVGGVQQYVSTIAQKLKDDHDIVVVTTQQSASEARHEIVDGVTIYRLPVLLRVSNTPYHPLWKRHFAAIFKKERPDVINAHAPVPWFADMAERASGAIPFVITYHSGSMKKGSALSDVIIHAYEKQVLTKTLRSSSQVVAVYPAFIRQLIGSSRRIEHITPGIDTAFFTPLKTSQHDYDLLFAGRLEKTSAWKGIPVLLEAFAALNTNDRSTKLCIAGDGDARSDYELLAKQLGIEHAVHFAGALSQQQLRDAYRKSKVVVLPSLSEAESFGMVIAEAASCGTPAIGTNIGGIPYVIDDGISGLLVAPNEPTDLAKALQKLLGDEPYRKKLGSAARKRAEALFSVESFAKKTCSVLDAATHSPSPKNLQITAFYPPALGGMERVAENIAIELAATGQSVEVVTSTIGHTPHFADHASDGYTVSRLPATMIAGLPVIPGLFLHLLRQPKRSVYHVHVAQAFIPEIALFAAWLRRGVFVAHFHLDVIPSGRFGVLFSAYKRFLFPKMLRSAHAVIVFSEDQKQLVSTRYGVSENRIRIIPNGIRRGFERTEKRTLRQPATLLFVGRLSTQKNIGFMLRALDGISETVTTRIVGDGELKRKYEQLAKKLELKNVTFVGRKDDDELRAEYEQADLFVLPSEREGMPLVLIDAMAMRLPAIGSDVLGIRDLIHHEHTGLLVPLDDTQALRHAITTLISSEEAYHSMSEASYEAVKTLAWPHLVRRLIKEVYS